MYGTLARQPLLGAHGVREASSSSKGAPISLVFKAVFLRSPHPSGNRQETHILLTRPQIRPHLRSIFRGNCDAALQKPTIPQGPCRVPWLMWGGHVWCVPWWPLQPGPMRWGMGAPSPRPIGALPPPPPTLEGVSYQPAASAANPADVGGIWGPD